MTDSPKAKKKLSAKCPACGDTIEFETIPELKDVLNCPCCESLLEVFRSAPVILMWMFGDERYSFEDVYTKPLDDDYDDITEIDDGAYDDDDGAYDDDDGAHDDDDGTYDDDDSAYDDDDE